MSAILLLLLFLKVFPGYKFYPLAQLSENVPILTCGAISKRLVNSAVIVLEFSFEIELQFPEN